MIFKQIKKRASQLFLLAFVFSNSIIEAETFPPTPKGSGGFDNGGVVGGPIDDYVPLVMLIAIAYVIWSQYKKKNPIAVK